MSSLLPSISDSVLLLLFAPGLICVSMQLRRGLANPLHVLGVVLLGFWIGGKALVVHSKADLLHFKPFWWHGAAAGASVLAALHFALGGRPNRPPG